MARAEAWGKGDLYESYVGRWSRAVARRFVEWIAVDGGASWLDVGCGTGALTETIAQHAAPSGIVGMDPSFGFVSHANAHRTPGLTGFAVADAQAIPFRDGSFDAAVSGLVLNFVPAPATAVGEMRRVVRSGSTVAAYVWDYAGKMQFMRRFWDAAASLDPAAATLDEGRRFSVTRPEKLSKLFADAGLERVETRPLDIDTHFRDFDDLWTPFLGGQGPAPGYVVSLAEGDRERLRERLRESLPVQPDGTIPLMARAWAVRSATP